jgi:hypothetical protein
MSEAKSLPGLTRIPVLALVMAGEKRTYLPEDHSPEKQCGYACGSQALQQQAADARINICVGSGRASQRPRHKHGEIQQTSHSVLPPDHASRGSKKLRMVIPKRMLLRLHRGAAIFAMTLTGESRPQPKICVKAILI